MALGNIIKKNPLKVKKIPISVTKDGALHVKQIRRQTNDQVLQEAFLHRGTVRLRLQPTIHAKGGNYLGWHDAAITCDFDTVERAKLFVLELERIIGELAQKHGFTAKKSAVLGGSK